MAESGIGTKAEKIKALVVSTLATYEQRRYYPFLTNEVNPFKLDIGPGKVKDLRLDDVLQLRIKSALIDFKGLLNKKHTDSKDLDLAALQKDYTKRVDAYKAANGNRMPAGADLVTLNKEFLADDANKKLIENLKITLLDDNKAQQTKRVAGATPASQLVVGDGRSLTPGRTFFTPVVIGTTDPGDEGMANAAAFKAPGFRSFYLDLAYDPAKKTLVMGHERGQVVKVGAVQHPAGSRAPAGHFIPYEKLFEMSMDYYNGDTAKHKLLGGKEAKKKGDAVIEVINIQVENQKNLLDKQGNAYLKIVGLGNTAFTDMQQPMDNFLDKVARLPTKKMGGKITLDVAKVDIKNPKVIKAIEDAFNEAQKDIDEKNAKEVDARKRALSQNDYLKELMKKHPAPPARGVDMVSATEIDDLIKNNALGDLVWKVDARAGERGPTAGADSRRLDTIAIFSEAYELKRVQEDMKNLKEAIKNHYPNEGLGMNAPQPGQPAIPGQQQQVALAGLLPTGALQQMQQALANYEGTGKPAEPKAVGPVRKAVTQVG